MNDNVPEKILRKADLSWDEMQLLTYFRGNPAEHKNILEILKRQVKQNEDCRCIHTSEHR